MRELDANSTQSFDIDLARIDILVDEFECAGKFKNHAKADNFLKRLKLAEAAPLLAEIVEKVIEQKDNWAFAWSTVADDGHNRYVKMMAEEEAELDAIVRSSFAKHAGSRTTEGSEG